MPDQIKILIADSAAEWQDTIRSILSTPRYKIVAVATTAAEVIRLAKTLQPDIVVLNAGIALQETTFFQDFGEVFPTASTIVITPEVPDSEMLDRLWAAGTFYFGGKKNLADGLAARIERVFADNYKPVLTQVEGQPHSDTTISASLTLFAEMWSGWSSSASEGPIITFVEMIHPGQMIPLVVPGYSDYVLQVVGADAASITLMIDGLGLKQGEERLQGTTSVHDVSWRNS